MKNKLFETIEIMRFPLIFLVVMAHMLPFDRIPIEFNLSTKNVYIFLSEMFSHNIAKISVRLFFIISGYFFYLKFEEFKLNNLKNKLNKKIKNLIVPYITWNTIAVIAIIIVNYVGSRFFSRSEEEIPSLYNIYWGYPINFSLWYVRNLMVVTIISPILYFYLKYTKLFGLLTLYLIYIFIHQSPIIGIDPRSVFFFSLGIYLAINKTDIIQLTQRHKYTVGIIATIFLLASTLLNTSMYHELIFRLFIIPGIITLFNIFYYLNNHKKIRDILLLLAPTSFFIYVTHQIFIINWIKGAISRSPILSTGIGEIISYFLGPVVCVIICITIFGILNKIIPNTLAFITGKRTELKSQSIQYPKTVKRLQRNQIILK